MNTEALDLIKRALSEDIRTGDVSSCCIPEQYICNGELLMKSSGVIAGLDIFEEVFNQVDPAVCIEKKKNDGEQVLLEKGESCQIAILEGKARSILQAERVALNFLQHLSGVATLTRAFVDKIKGSTIIIRDTRKTLPGLRFLEKKAVVLGGGQNHRMAMDDMVLIKDTHWEIVRKLGLPMSKYVADLKTKTTVPIEIEAKTLEEVQEALGCSPDCILLDGMNLSLLRQAISLLEGHCKIEVSGGVTLENIGTYASLPIDFIAIGALTHSAPAVDFSIEITEQ